MTVKKGLRLFVCFTIFSVLGIIFFTADRRSLYALFHANLRYLGIALMMVFSGWLFDAARLYMLTLAAGEKIRFVEVVPLIWLGYFGAAITPFQSGGGPFVVYMMYTKGLPLGKSVAITLVRALLTLFMLGFSVPVVFLLYPGDISGGLMSGVFYALSVFVLFLWFVVFVSLFKPSMMKRFGGWIVVLAKKTPFFKNHRTPSILRLLYKEIDTYNDNFRLFFGSGKMKFTLALIFTFMTHFSLFMVLPCVIKALGLPVDIIHAVLLQAVFLFVLFFVPTPGASGVAEGGGAAIYHVLLPMHLAGIAAVSWRFFTEYIAIVLGAIVAIKYFGISNMDEKTLMEKVEENVNK